MNIGSIGSVETLALAPCRHLQMPIVWYTALHPGELVPRVFSPDAPRVSPAFSSANTHAGITLCAVGGWAKPAALIDEETGAPHYSGEPLRARVR